MAFMHKVAWISFKTLFEKKSNTMAEMKYHWGEAELINDGKDVHLRYMNIVENGNNIKYDKYACIFLNLFMLELIMRFYILPYIRL